MSDLAVQDRLYPDLPCFGCGPSNPKGLQLKSFGTPDDMRATFLPWPEHDNGVGFLNGGIIATLLDCHSAAAAQLCAHDNGWEPLGGAPLAFVTAGLDVRYLRPSPLLEAVDLRAQVTSADDSTITVDVELWWEQKPRAAAAALWKRWRPRA
ncbi:MAG TPA: PaaI family thioesterase [Mycobacteriales bacterium]|nr:PaaI family thioesterase [Mycobacteriales bacterium]